MGNFGLKLVIAALVTLYHVPSIHSRSSGAPSQTCLTLTPSHGDILPQTTNPPFTVTVDKDDVEAGETVVVTVESTGDGDPFKGFLAIGNKANVAEISAAGVMSLIDGGEGPPVKTVECSTGLGITHSNTVEKNRVVFNWIAPNATGTYVILTTVVREYSTFWVKVASKNIMVKGPGPVEGDVPPEASAELRAKMDEYYSNCGSSKGCFGVPAGCIETKKCDMWSTWRVDSDGNHRFQIAGMIPGDSPTRGHVSMGWSYDTSMGQDSVIGCVFKNSTAQPKSFYNMVTEKNNQPFPDPTAGLVPADSYGQYLEGWVFCNFTREPLFNQPQLQRPFDLSKDQFYILMARSQFLESDEGENPLDRLGGHFAPGPGQTGVGGSGEATLMSSTRILGSKSSLLIQLHGAVMVIAWVMTSSLGIFVARYYKQTLTSLNPLNKAFWFVVHVGSMFLTIGLTFLGIIFIFVEIGGYSSNISTQAGKAHPILGLILTGICCLQLTIGLLRPHPGTPKRALFNWVHWTAGNVGHIVGVACIFLATELSKSGVQNSLPWLITVIVFVVFHVLMHASLSAHTVWADKQMNSSHKLRGISVGPMKPSMPEEAPGTGLRTFLLTLYIGGIVAIGITLITLMVLANATHT